MMKMIMELEKPAEGGEGEGEEVVEVEETNARPDNVWSWRDLKTTVARSFAHYREDYGRGLCLVW